LSSKEAYIDVVSQLQTELSPAFAMCAAKQLALQVLSIQMSQELVEQLLSHTQRQIRLSIPRSLKTMNRITTSSTLSLKVATLKWLQTAHFKNKKRISSHRKAKK
jgi:hypothetical protein